MTPSIKRRLSHGIDVTEAATMQEQYFMVIAGLLQKNLEMTEKLVEKLTAKEQHVHVQAGRPSLNIEDITTPLSQAVKSEKPTAFKSKRQQG